MINELVHSIIIIIIDRSKFPQSWVDCNYVYNTYWEELNENTTYYTVVS